MRTEEQIVYDLMNILAGGRVSADDVTSERLMRSFLRKHRASKMVTYFNKGKNVADYVFQPLGNIEFKLSESLEFSTMIPAIINFDDSLGIKLSKNRLVIPVVDEESFELSLHNPINKSHPKAKLDGNQLTVYIGDLNKCDYLPNSLAQQITRQFLSECGQIDDEPKIYVNVKAVLYDPEQGVDYDWTKTPYPCPSDVIDSIETSTLSRDFELMIRRLPDQADNKTQIDNVQ